MSGPGSGRRWPERLAPLLGRAGELPRVTDRERWVVRGGPGTGKTALVADVVRAALLGGTRLDQVLVLTHSAVAGAALLDEVTTDLAGTGVVGTDPPIRTVHSLAFGILRLAASRADAPPPRLLTGAEHDAVVRETLLGEIEDGADTWPEALRPALATVGFARELRDLLLRATERGVGPDELARLGEAAGRPAWVAAAGFLARHEQQMELRAGVRAAESGSAAALNAAELVTAALDALEADPDLLELVRGHCRLLAVDDAHGLDPLAGELVTRIGGGAALLLVVEDGDQSVFRFRGAGGDLARAVVDQGGRELVLDEEHRLPPELAAVAARVSERLPGAPAHRASVRAARAAREATTVRDAQEGAHAPGVRHGTVAVRRLPTAATEAAAVADFLRRRHVLDGVPWSEMAVVARSLPAVSDALFAAADAAGIPVVDAGAEIPPAHDPVVAALLAALRSLYEPPGVDLVLGLLSGPLGRADPVALRRLRRGIRRSGLDGGVRPSAEVLRDLVLGAPAGPGDTRDSEDGAENGAAAGGEAAAAAVESDPAVAGALTPIELEPVTRVREVREAAALALDRGDSVEEVVWAAWQAAGLAHRLAAQSAAGDAWSRQADRSLDAVIALFDHAADFVDRVPGGSLKAFVDLVSAHDLPAPRRADTRVRPDAVSLLSAHSAVGGQWRAVAVCGVQDGRWPAPPRRSGVLGVDEFVDLTAGGRGVLGAGPVPPVAERLASAHTERAAEERRLFHLACSRASEHLLVTAVESPESGEVAASRYLDEIRDLATVGDEREPGDTRPGRSVFTLPHLVAELRTVVHRGVAGGTPVADAPAADAPVADAPVRGASAPDASGAGPSAEVRDAAALLAGLRDAGVPEADPDTWYGVAELSDARPPFGEPGGGAPAVVLSPSGFGALEECPARWFLERSAGSSDSSGAMLRGTVVHALAQAVEGGVDEQRVADLVRRRWPALTPSRGWFAEREVEQVLAMVEAFRGWRSATRGELTVAGVEVPFTFGVDDVVVRGRIDRLERTRAGSSLPVDVKTGTSVVSLKDAQAHPQLALYQLAVVEGAGDAGGPQDRVPAGGTLVYVGGGKATERTQDPLTEGTADELRGRVVAAGHAQRGPEYPARVGSWCSNCAVRSCCPAQPEGEQVAT